MTRMLSVDSQNCLIIIILCLFSVLYLFFSFFKKPKESRPPSPPSLPIIGHLHHLLSTRFHKSFQLLSAKYGSILHLHVFNFPILLVSSPSLAYEIFRTHDLKVSSHGDPPIEESLVFGSSGFFMAPYGDYWKFMKKNIVTKYLGPQGLEQSRGVRAVELERFYARLMDKASKKESVGILSESIRLVTNSIFKISMGRGCLEESNEVETVMGLTKESASLQLKIFLAHLLRKPLEKLGLSLFKKEIMDVSHRLEELLERMLAEHEQKLDDHHQVTDMMDAILEIYRDENEDYKITRNHIKALFVELFLGASDTSSTAIEWTMAEIINNPNILERLREEIDSVVGKTRLIQETDLPKLPYLQAVVKEGLRLHPVVPLLIRKFQEGCEIGGFYVAENTTLVVNAYAMMRDPNVWENPEEFKPERFLASSRSGAEEEEIKEKTLKFLPFGRGRRGCPGANLGSIFVGTAIGLMVQCFEWEIKGDKVNIEEAAGTFFLTLAHPLNCIPHPRT